MSPIDDPSHSFINKERRKDQSSSIMKNFATKNAEPLKASIKKENDGGKCRSKRPDKPLYVPRALRIQKKDVHVNENECNTADSPANSSSCHSTEITSLKPHSTLVLPTEQNNGNSWNCVNERTVSHEFSESSMDLNIKSSDETVCPISSVVCDNKKYWRIRAELDSPMKGIIRDATEILKDCKIKNITDSETCESNDSCSDGSKNIKKPIVPSSNGTKLSVKSESLKDGWNKNSYENCDSSVLSNETDSWDCMFNDQGECLNPDVLKELAGVVENTEVHFAKNCYSEFNSEGSGTNDGEEDTEELSHIVELHGFPVQFNTQDLVSVFSSFKSEDFTIKWVDDNHALAIFPTPFSASQALSMEHPFVKIRPLSQGLPASRLKAKRVAESLEPVKPRPATSATLARRLVTGALGLKVNIPKEQREKERKEILEAKAKQKKEKTEAAKQRKDVWEGIVP